MNSTFPNPQLLSALAITLLATTLSTRSDAQDSPSGTPPAAKLEGQPLLLEAVARIEKYATIEANLGVRTNLLGQPLVGTGKYAQLAASSGLLLRLELAIQAGQQPTSVRQINDGKSLWEHWRLGTSERVNHIDLTRIARSMKNHADAPSYRSHLAIGGLPKLLQQLSENFDFNTRPIQYHQVDDEPLVSLVGVWRSDQLAKAAPQAVEGTTIQFDRLPPHLPRQVELILGRDNLFPYRVTYQKWDPASASKWQPIVVTQFFEVAFNEPLDPTQFQYKRRSDLPLAEQTDTYLQSMGIAAKPDESANR